MLGVAKNTYNQQCHIDGGSNVLDNLSQGTEYIYFVFPFLFTLY